MVALLVLALVAAAAGVWTVRRSFARYDGTLRLDGLSADVTVYRDDHGIPQVYARTADDLYRAQGYVHAQERFWEMDFRRHVTAGRLSELFGSGQVETDVYLRTLGWRRVAQQEWDLLSADTRRYLTAYADGVNAWLADHDGSTASLEYAVLGLQNSGYRIERWDPVDSLAWLKAMAWDLRGNMAQEIERAVLLGSGLTRAQVEQLFPAYPFDRNAPIVSGGTVTAGAFTASGTSATSTPGGGAAPASGTGGGTGTDLGDAPVTGAELGAAPLGRLGDDLARLPELLGTNGAGIGSNSWVLAGSRTVTGKPILANDPHLGPSMPAIWFQIGLHCDCGLNVEGFSFSGLPGVVIGHNDRIAWGFTNLGPDVTDLYLEKVDGDRYLVDGQWRDLDKRQETITVAGGKPVTVTVRTSKDGPLLSDASAELRGIGTAAPVTADGRATDTAAKTSPGYAVALRWTALDPGRTAEAIFTLNNARGWSDFRRAAAQFEVPAQNLVYADVDGNIGYQSPGRIPVRGKGDGHWPAPGWDSAYEWKSFVPFDELPSVFNPEQGYVVTANQAVIDAAYPRFLTDDWSYGYRAQRIKDMIDGAGTRISVADVTRMQMDNRNGMAPALVPALLRADLTGQAGRAQELLRGWDFQQPADGEPGSPEAKGSAAAAYYNSVWRHLLLRTFDELPADHRPDGEDRWFEVVRALLDDPASAWWDDRSTRARETRDEIVAAAMRDAYDELSQRLGGDPSTWRWGALHEITVRNQSFGTSGIAPIEWLFNVGPAPTSGGGSIVNATGWDARNGYQVDWVPSMRMVVDLSNLDTSRWVQLMGQSGHAFSPHYRDQFELWRTGGTLPMRWERATIAREAKHTLTLHP
ncbi:penicillin acylase family protein [Planosporangium sp. 12N6]|uniref:penicillin acylase family protein n=1 Tax=Planosporangium spinosum TaxID=3402278 RepID=UPI003CED6DEA